MHIALASAAAIAIRTSSRILNFILILYFFDVYVCVFQFILLHFFFFAELFTSFTGALVQSQPNGNLNIFVRYIYFFIGNGICCFPFITSCLYIFLAIKIVHLFDAYTHTQNTNHQKRSRNSQLEMVFNAFFFFFFTNRENFIDFFF